MSQPVLLTLVGLILATPRAAHAYVDPGSGSMIWQLAAAAVIGSLFYVRRALTWLRDRMDLRKGVGDSTRDSVR